MYATQADEVVNRSREQTEIRQPSLFLRWSRCSPATRLQRHSLIVGGETAEQSFG